MEYIPDNSLFKYNQSMLFFLRNQHGFDTVKRINDAIDVLEEWVVKQEHFKKKSFDRDYLERLLIANKGSVEKSKKKLDNLCTLRTLLPDIFSTKPVDKELLFNTYSDALLTQMTSDYGRVHVIKVVGKKFRSEIICNYLKYYILILHYLQMKDYYNHVTIFVDFTEVNLIEYVKAFDIVEARKCSEVTFEGFSMRMKGLHFLTNSKAIETLVTLIKPLLGQKLSERVHIHRSIEAAYEYIPKDIFPQEYGGKDKTLSQLREDLFNELYSKEFTEYREEMNKACTNEAYRQKDKFNEEYLGISGTFRTMTVD